MVFGQNVVEIVIRARDKFSKAFNKAGLSMQNFRKSALAMGAIGGAIAFGMYKAVDASNKVETSFARVNTLLEKGQNAQELFGDYVAKANIELGNQGTQLDVLNGLYQTISAGITDTADAQKVMDAAVVSTVGGMANQNDVINALTKTMAAYGLGADDAASITDKFAGTVKAGQTTMGELASAFPTVAGVAGEMGVSLEETLGTFAGLTKFMGSSEEATTSLSAVIRAFIKPTGDMKDVIKLLGYESASAMIKEEGLNESVRLVTDAVNSDTEAMGKLFPNIRALKAILPMTGKAAEDVASSIDIVTNSAGLAQKQMEDVTDTMEYRWGQATSELSNLQIELGNEIKNALVPIMEGLVNVIGWLSEKWKNLSPITKQIIVIFGAVTAAVFLLAGAIALLTLISSPWLLILFAIAAAITAVVLVVKNWSRMMDWLKEKVKMVYDFLKGFFAPGIEFVTSVVNLLTAAFRWLWDHGVGWVWEKLKGFYNWVKDKLLWVLEKAVGLIKSVTEKSDRAQVKYGYTPATAMELGRGIVGSKQTGGLIDKTGLYNLHKGEVVIPKNKVSNGITFIVQGNLIGLDEQEISRALSDELNAKLSL